MLDINARKISLSILREWEESSKFIDFVIERKCQSVGLNGRDRAYVQNLTLGVIRNLSLLDDFVEKLRKGKISSETRRLLYLGIFQVLLMRTPDHAAVNETVNLTKGKTRGLVNAILRRCVREKEVFLRDLDSLHPSDRFSIPDHIYSKWENQFGEKNAALIAAYSNNPAKVTVRSNPLLGGLTNEDLSEVNATQINDYDDFFEVQKLPMEALNSGRCYVQDPSTSIAPNLLNPQSTHTVLDACASPGGKTAIISAKMSNQGKIIAADVEGPRSDRLIQNLERLGIGNTKIIRCDLRDEENRLKDEKLLFDKILLDVPCTNSGVFRRRPDAKWRLLPHSTADMTKLQLHLINSILPLLKKGGHLVYSTCSIDAEENTGVVSKLLETHNYLKKLDEVQLLPSENNDGAYAALIG
tara:strand:- start:491 stop:1729 length:1239 start_codon:yes stop_codon:yes gene_type:complete